MEYSDKKWLEILPNDYIAFYGIENNIDTYPSRPVAIIYNQNLETVTPEPVVLSEYKARSLDFASIGDDVMVSWATNVYDPDYDHFPKRLVPMIMETSTQSFSNSII